MVAEALARELGLAALPALFIAEIVLATAAWRLIEPRLPEGAA